MSFAELNGIPITKGEIRSGLVGAWEARSLTVSTDNALLVTGPVSLVIGSTTLIGTASVADADRGGLVTVRVVGGKDGLRTVCPPHPYMATTRGVLLTDALAVGKEALSPLSDVSVTLAPIQRWTRVQDAVGGHIKRILDGTGASWRVLPDGSFWVGAEKWLPVDPSNTTVTKEEPTQMRITLALESLGVMPGDVFEGHQISSVVYELNGSRLSASLSYAPGGRSGIAAELSTFVKGETQSSDLSRVYSAQVIGQNGDGSLELKLIDPTLPHLSKVPIRFGIPGITATKIANGTQVLLAHENADEQKPIVTGFAQAQVLSIALESPDVKIGFPSSAALAAAVAPLVKAELVKIATTIASGVCASPGSPVVYANPYIPGDVAAKTVSIV